MASTQVSQKCSNCGKSPSALKRCGKCRIAGYCNRDCQSSHWQKHKKECAAKVAGQSRGGRDLRKPFHAIHNNTFLHDRTEEETFRILIDAVRMRQEDIYHLYGERMFGTIHGGDRTCEVALRQFLHKAKEIRDFLPPWWNDSKADSCIEYGSGRNPGFSLAEEVTKASIQEVWRDDRMPMKLRLLAERVIGPMDDRGGGPAMLQAMMRDENGGDPDQLTALIDMKFPRRH